MQSTKFINQKLPLKANRVNLLIIFASLKELTSDYASRFTI